MSNPIRYGIQGQMGDMFHSICVCKYFYEQQGRKADLFISDREHPFYFGLERAYKELSPILLSQPWVNSFQIQGDHPIDIDLTSFRGSPKLFKTNWLEIHFDLHLPGESIPKEYKWIDVGVDSKFEDFLIVNRSLKPDIMTRGVIDRYAEIIQGYEKRYFVCSDENQYNKFALKDICPMLKVDDLYSFLVVINSCKQYLGNQSGPSAWATAMNVNRIVELRNDIDRFHYETDTKYYSKFQYFIGD